MEFIRGLYNIKPEHRGAVVTIGNFDGVHLGHNALIKKVKERAKALHTHSIVITFEPQPLEYFSKEATIARLTRWREKIGALKETGVDFVLALRFNEKLAKLSATDFVKQVLVDSLGVEHVIVGDDFQFGSNRTGDFKFLQMAGEDFGFTVESMSSVFINEKRVSSTLIREVLANGDHVLAQQYLGRPYTMHGKVVHGNKLGRELGFPTANIYIHRPLTAVQGIYIVRMHGIEEHGLPGVANVGIRPTVGGTRSLLEVYLFNFGRDIYGRQVSVEFCEKIRPEEHYVSLRLLREAIAKDAAQARDYFEKRGEL